MSDETKKDKTVDASVVDADQQKTLNELKNLMPLLRAITLAVKESGVSTPVAVTALMVSAGVLVDATTNDDNRAFAVQSMMKVFASCVRGCSVSVGEPVTESDEAEQVMELVRALGSKKPVVYQ